MGVKQGLLFFGDVCPELLRLLPHRQRRQATIYRLCVRRPLVRNVKLESCAVQSHTGKKTPAGWLAQAVAKKEQAGNGASVSVCSESFFEIAASGDSQSPLTPRFYRFSIAPKNVFCQMLAGTVCALFLVYRRAAAANTAEE